MTDAEIADLIEIKERTFHRWKAEHPEFCQSLMDGKVAADAEVAGGLFNRATGQATRAAVKVFLSEHGEPVYAPYIETTFSDVGAAKLWLTNRQPGRWRERRPIDVTLSLEQRIS